MSALKEKLLESLPEGMEAFLPEQTRELESFAREERGTPKNFLEKNGKEASAAPKLSRIAELILGVDARAIGYNDEVDESEIRSTARKQLAASLGCTIQDIEIVVESYEDAWDGMVLEERIRLGIDSVTVRDATWDRLESAVLRKLIRLVDRNLVKEVGELVAIAKTANGAIRGERKGNGGGRPQEPGGVNMQINNYLPGNPENGILPAGNLGKITLNLTPRIVKQIESTVVKKEGRQIDSVDMMNLEEIQRAAKDDEEDSQVESE